MASPTNQRTVGEELFLVHLHRQLQEEDDTIIPRIRSRSVGEELYEIHLKRAQGIEPETDLSITPPPTQVSGHVLQLRSRNVPPKTKLSNRSN